MELYNCYKCGRYVKIAGCLCSYCFNRITRAYSESPTFDAVTEMSKGNINTRLKEGFRLLSEYNNDY